MWLIHPVFSHMSKNKDQDKRCRIGTEGTERYIMCCKKQCKKDNCTYNKNPPVKSNDHAHRGCNSFSTAKFHGNWEIMSQNTAQSSIKRQKRENTAHGVPINHSHDHNGKHTLQAVSQKCKRSRLFSESAECVGRSRISASMLSDICLVKLSYNITCLEKSAYITNNKTNNTFHIFIPFPRARG